MLLTILTFVIVLGVLVLVHEFGHFITAKRAGMAVEEFGFGFPPRLLSIRRGGTRYSLNLIPFGGFVKILGEGGEDKTNPKSFAHRGVGIRALVVAAGILMNYVLAVVLLTIVNAVGVHTALEPDQPPPAHAVVSPTVVTVAFVENDSPAAQAGVHPGDIVVSVDGAPVESVSQTVDTITQKSGASATVLLRRGDTPLTVSVTPRVNPPEGQGPVGVQLISTATVRYAWYRAPWEAIKQTVFLTWQIISSFGQLISRLVHTGTVGGDVAGPVGIAVLTGQVRELGFLPLLQFVALLSINLAIINVVPFPALDGGRLLFLAIEKIRRRSVSKRLENALHTIGFGLLITLILLITVRDVIRLF
ncbi:MAG: RIP metalloprotease RseP [Candidatus Andersenbacteria bacterium]